MVKRRYGIINNKGVFTVKTDTYMKYSYLAYFSNKSEDEKRKVWDKFSNTYNKAFDYSCTLNGNIAIGLKNNKILCVWEMSNRDSTYKEFMI